MPKSFSRLQDACAFGRTSVLFLPALAAPSKPTLVAAECFFSPWLLERELQAPSLALLNSLISPILRPKNCAIAGLPMATSTALHRVRFVDYAPSGVVHMSLHPNGRHLAVARENGDVELWACDAVPEPAAQQQQQRLGDAPGTKGDAPPAWVIVSVVPGRALVALRALSWARATCPSVAGSLFEGAHLLAASLNGSVYEVNWAALTLHACADVNGGAAWSLSVQPLMVTHAAGGRSACAGNLAAVGCEDGCVRVYHVRTTSPDSAAGGSYHLGGGSGGVEATLVATCPGTDGRVLCVAWHPSLPVVFSGTSTGVIRGWDVSGAASAITAEARAATERRVAAAAAASAAALAASLAVAVPRSSASASSSSSFSGYGGAAPGGKRVGVRLALQKQRRPRGLSADSVEERDASGGVARGGGREHLRVAHPAETLITLRTVRGQI